MFTTYAAVCLLDIIVESLTGTRTSVTVLSDITWTSVMKWLTTRELPLGWFKATRYTAPPLNLPVPLRSHLLHELRLLLQNPLTPRGDLSSSIAYSWLHLLLRRQSRPPPHHLRRYFPDGGWVGGWEGWDMRRGVAEDQVFLQGLDYWCSLNKGGTVCGLQVESVWTNSCSPLHPFSHTKAQHPPTCVPSPLEGRSSHKQTSWDVRASWFVVVVF